MKAIAYCTKCEINWARLGTQTIGDEVYEYCPVCNSDLDLLQGKDGDVYMSTVDGRIINAITKVTYEKCPPVIHAPPPDYRPASIPTPAQRDEMRIERERKEDDRINAYIASYDQKHKAIRIQQL